MGIHENASSSSLRVESNLSAAPFNVFQRIEKKKLLMSWVGCIKFQGLKTFLIFCFFSPQPEKRGKPEWSCAKMKDLVFSFPRSWICLIWAKVFPKDDRRTLAKPTQEWSVINSKGSLALKTELYPKFCLTYTVLGKAKRMISRSWWVLKEKSHTTNQWLATTPNPNLTVHFIPLRILSPPNDLPLLTHPSPHLRWANPCQKRFASGSHQRLQNKSRWSR